MKMLKNIFSLLFIFCFCYNKLNAQISLKSLGSSPAPSKSEKPDKPQNTTPAPQPEKPAVKQAEKPANVNPAPVVKKEIPFVEPAMIMVDGGTFAMGSNDNFTNEKPQHNVTVGSFYMGKYEVTQAQWKSLMGAISTAHDACDECPVENVTWSEVQEFLAKLNKKTGKVYRLPTEAEWEFAARGGNKSGHFAFAGSNTNTAVGWCAENSEGHTHPVGTKDPNELGLYDMCGNVTEFCSDWYDKAYYSSSPAENPKGPATGENKVRKGGSFKEDNKNSRSACRNIAPPDVRGDNFGFRLVRNQ